MAKKKKEEKKEEEIEITESEASSSTVTEKVEKVTSSSVNKVRVDDFLESSELTKGKYNLKSSGFKTWWSVDRQRSIGEMLTISEWQKEFDTFLNRKIK